MNTMRDPNERVPDQEYDVSLPPEASQDIPANAVNEDLERQVRDLKAEVKDVNERNEVLRGAVADLQAMRCRDPFAHNAPLMAREEEYDVRDVLPYAPDKTWRTVVSLFLLGLLVAIPFAMTDEGVVKEEMIVPAVAHVSDAKEVVVQTSPLSYVVMSLLVSLVTVTLWLLGKADERAYPDSMLAPALKGGAIVMLLTALALAWSGFSIVMLN